MSDIQNKKKPRRKPGPKASGMTKLTIRLMKKHINWLDFLVGKATYGHSQERVAESLLHRVFREMLAAKELPEETLAAEVVRPAEFQSGASASPKQNLS